MVIRNGADSIELTVREMGPRGTPAEGDLCLRISVTTSAFSGHVDEIWIGRDEWGGFLADMEDLERHRRGEAHVTAMSPEEFQLDVFAMDRAGHMAAEGWIGHEYRGRDGTLRHRVSFSVEIAPDDLPRLVAEFVSLSLNSRDIG